MLYTWNDYNAVSQLYFQDCLFVLIFLKYEKDMLGVLSASLIYNVVCYLF